MPRRVLSTALTCAALLAGCGGGDEGPQTKEGFVAAADGVCADLAVELAEAGAKDPGTAKQVRDANRVLADLYQDLSDRLAEVRLPDAGTARTEAEAFIESVRRADPLLDELRTASEAFLQAAKDNDARALAKGGNDVRAALDRFRAARAESDRLAVAYGLNSCGNIG